MKPLNIRSRLAPLWTLVSLALVTVSLQAQESRIQGRIDSTKTIPLKGNVNPKAQARYDLGPVDPSFKLSYITLALKPSAQQQAALEQLLAEQQDRSSPNYHQWLTPEQYADRLGLSAGDIAKLTGWLQSKGFTINHVARSRNWIGFTGTAAQIESNFHTSIHSFRIDGETHFANAGEPSIPTTLEPIVLGVLGLDDFQRKPAQILLSAISQHNPDKPQYTASNGFHALVPDDIATIYDITRLYQLGFDGSGQRVVVVGQSDINLSDIASFRSGILPVNVPEVLLVPGSADPGTTQAQDEADLDIEWVGAVARNAQIIYVNSTDVLNSVRYAISDDIAPVITFSYSFGCEQAQSSAALSEARSIVQQANVQGITVVAASGDSGAAGCDTPFAATEATQGLAVSAAASIPEVTAVGGTEFNDGGGNYWSNSNSSTLSSALSYIPEMAWNESLQPAPGWSGGLAASGGGVSIFYPQPSWQVGPGLPTVNARAVPDVALTAAGHDPYYIVIGGQQQFMRGTSASSPVFAGIVALLNQYEHSNGQGNINPNLYRLAQTNIFHDITSGSNVVPCSVGTPDCTTGSFGYYTGPGYDPVTGLGSVDAYNLVTEWNATTSVSNVVPSCNPDPVYEQAPNSDGFSWLFTLTLTDTAGVGTTLTGFTVNGMSYASQIASFFGTSTIPGDGMISALLGYKTLTVPTTLVFGFVGVDAGGHQWSQQLSVPFNGMQQSSTPSPSISSVVNAASYQAGMSPGALATLFGTNLSPVVGIETPGGATSYQGVSVTVGGTLAPLFIVANVNGQEQINFQVPTGTLASEVVEAVKVNNNGSVGTMNVTLRAVQPGVFTYVPSGSFASYAVIVKPDGSIAGPSNPVTRGSTVVMFATGLGPTSPALATGQPGPVPVAHTSYLPVVAINGVSAPVLFSGVAPGFIGLDQVNFTIPANAPVGLGDTLNVTVNGVASQNSGIAVQ